MTLQRLSQRIRVILLVAVVALLAVPAAPALAQDCTLADHIRSANTNTAVGFCPAGTSHDIITITEDITLDEALPPITGTITIEGGGHTISGGGKFRIFDVHTGGRLTIKQLTLINGNGGRLHGGAVRLDRDAQLLVEDSMFHNNSARYGGAIGARRQSRFGGASGARSQSSVTIRNSSFKDNWAESGGAITLATSEATVQSSSFRQNLARLSGGAILIYSGEIAINNSTLFSNVAGAGGAVYVSGGDVTLSHLTMLDNAATGPEGAVLRRENRSGSLNLYNSIIAGGSAASLCSARIDYNMGNLIEDWSCNPEFGGDPMLDRVEGASLYFAPRDDSPVINAAYPMFCPPRDQIGTGRPYGAACEIGAVESTSAGATGVGPLVGVCTLRDRILAANSNQVVGNCPAGTSHDVITITEDITLRLPLPSITGTITIEGGGHTISGDGKFRIFTVNGGNLTVNNLTLKDGKTEDSGGAIHVRAGGRLAVKSSTFSGNSAGLGGGAIDLTGSTRVASDDPNTSDRIYYSRGTGLTVNDSAFISNTSDSYGGALYFNHTTTTISNSSFIKNAAVWGGAIFGDGDKANISNSTFSGNRARWGGAMLAYGAITLTHVTMVDNESSRGGSGESLDMSYRQPAEVRLRNSIIAGGGLDPLCTGRLAQNSANFISDGSCSASMSGDVLLGELTGTRAHHALLDGSPAIDAADSRYCSPTDQVGNPRPQGWGCDIGAIESAVVSAVRPDSFEPEPVDTAQEEKADLDCQVTTTHELNLREEASLSGNRVGRVRQGETLQVIERSASWLSVNYRGATGWISAYYVDAQGDCGFPPQPQSRTSARATGPQSDNCCNIGWNCADDRDWANGQWAFANNYCEHPTPHDGRRDDAASCCHHGWYCTFDFDWTLGRMQVSDLGVDACGSPTQETLEGVIIEGPPWFIKHTREALALMKTSAPEWYAYTIAGPLKIRYRQWLSSHSLGRSINLGSIFAYDEPRFTATMIVHESCHVQRWLHHVWRDNELENQAEEAVCDTVALNVLDQFALGPRVGYERYERNRIEEFLELGLDFDLDASANREWERAKLILSRMN